MGFRLIQLRPKSRDGLAWRFWQIGWGGTLGFLAAAPLAILNVFQAPSLLLLPFSRRAFRRYNAAAAFCVWGLWVWGIRHLCGFRIDFDGDDVPRGESALVISNHQEMADLVPFLTFAQVKGMKNIKAIAKNAIKFVPGLGWGAAFLGFLFLKRAWSADKLRIQATFERYRAEGVPLWLLIFPEGTRIRADLLARSNQFARKTGVAPTQYVLLPRPRGFVAATLGLRASVTAVYSLTLGYYERPPSLFGILLGDLPRVYMHVKRYPLSELPQDDDGLTAWLEAEFRRKDEILARFYERIGRRDIIKPARPSGKVAASATVAQKE